MAISTFIDRPRRSGGTIYGVPFTFHYQSYEYELIDGTRFEEHKYDDMVDYVMRNLKSLEKYVLGRQRPSPADLNDRRLFIINENKKAQLKWDKNFNRRVVELVRKAIEENMVHLKVATIRPFDIHWLDGNHATIATPDYKTFDIFYDRTLPESEAYLRCREQAENAVRKSMPPPDLLPMV